MAVAARKRYAVADFFRFPDDGFRHEIIDGDWIMSPPPGLNHQRVIQVLLAILERYLAKTRSGEVFVAPVGVILGRNDAVQPDLVYLSKARAKLARKDAIHGAPDLVVEVLSPSTASYDRDRKRALYARSGVREYWIADPEERALEVYEFGRARRVRFLQEGQSFDPALFPGLTIKIADLFLRVR